MTSCLECICCLVDSLALSQKLLYRRSDPNHFQGAAHRLFDRKRASRVSTSATRDALVIRIAQPIKQSTQPVKHHTEPEEQAKVSAVHNAGVKTWMFLHTAGAKRLCSMVLQAL